ncbi:hypothetical protein [Arthrobacter mobilis]|uniref:Uncharacterized protein n=1 Tax=Arthrobacter mobilis TaxID=2724944 RepID=A0A7X6HEL6_9MICC|nr:hypothetical protein [Arthrobacter mobilis]NKX54576.1 hypothetical protein [Arthrobacter mobilis]
MTPTERILYRLSIYVPHTYAPTQVIRDAVEHIRVLDADLTALQAAYAALQAEHLAMRTDRDRLAQTAKEAA